MNLETFKFDIDADGIAHAVFDVPGRSMNTLTAKAIADIIAITKEVGENDAIVPVVNGKILKMALPNSQLHVMEDAGHLFIVTKMDETRRIIANFLTEEPSQTEAAA